MNYLGRDERSYGTAYKRYMMDGLKTGIANPFEDVRSQVILGSEGFVDKMRRYLNRGVKIREVPALRSLRKVLTIEQVLDEIVTSFHIEKERVISKKGKRSRQIAMEMAYRHTDLNQERIGKVFGVDYSTVSQNRRRLGMLLKEDRKLLDAFHGIDERLNKLSNQKI